MTTPARAGDGGTVSTTGGSITPQASVPRFYAGSDAGAPGHLNNFTPAAINYADCIEDLDLEFTLDVDNPNGDDIQVWAGAGSADCTQASAREAASVTDTNDFPGRCWPAAPTNVFDPTKASPSARLHVLDLVAHIGDPAAYIPYAATTSTKVCKPLATNGPVQLNIYFLLVPPSSSGSAGDAGTASKVSAPDGVSGLYRTAAALIGPIAPLSVSVPNSGITPTSLFVQWEPQTEATIQGYNIYVQDQGATGENTGASADGGGAVTISGVQCHLPRSCTRPGVPDAGRDADSDAGAHDGGASDAAKVDATVDAAVDAGGSPASGSCDAGLADAFSPVDAAAYVGLSDAAIASLGCEFTGTVNVVSPSLDSGGGSACVSGVLTSTFTVDGGTSSTATGSTGDSSIGFGVGTTVDAGDAGDASDDAASTSTTITTTTGTNAETAGISNISNAYFNSYQSGQTTDSYTIDNLTTGHHYAVAVAAVDSFGNVGPVGNLGCSIPTNVADFYTVYSMDGGSAGGGFCALVAPGAPAYGSLAGAGVVAVAVTFLRRRSRRRRGGEAASP